MIIKTCYKKFFGLLIYIYTNNQWYYGNDITEKEGTVEHLLLRIAVCKLFLFQSTIRITWQKLDKAWRKIRWLSNLQRPGGRHCVSTGYSISSLVIWQNTLSCHSLSSVDSFHCRSPTGVRVVTLRMECNHGRSVCSKWCMCIPSLV